MIDILIRHATVVTVDSKRRVLEDGAIAIKADRIVAVGADSEVCAAHGDAAQIIDGPYWTPVPAIKLFFLARYFWMPSSVRGGIILSCLVVNCRP